MKMNNHNKPTEVNSNNLWIILAITNLVLVLFIVNNVLTNRTGSNSNQVDTQPPPSATITSSSSTVENSGNPELTEITLALETPSSEIPLYILSIYVNQKSQLYAFHPDDIPFTRLLDEPYEEIHPSISHDNTKIAYSAKKNGYWDIYILDLSDGSEMRVTDSPEYDGSPTWSSDDLYIAYESYSNGNLDIFIQDLQSQETDPIQLTNGDEPQYSPAWSPDGRKIAFVSTEGGNEEIWLAKLGTIEDRFEKITDRPKQIDIHPQWSADGEKLLWTSENYGYPRIMQADFSNSSVMISEVTMGDSAILTTNLLSYIQLEANQNFLISKNQSGNLLFPSTEIPGNINGFAILPNYTDNEFLLSQIEMNPKLNKKIEKINRVIRRSWFYWKMLKRNTHISPVQSFNHLLNYAPRLPIFPVGISSGS